MPTGAPGHNLPLCGPAHAATGSLVLRGQDSMEREPGGTDVAVLPGDQSAPEVLNGHEAREQLAAEGAPWGHRERAARAAAWITVPRSGSRWVS